MKAMLGLGLGLISLLIVLAIAGQMKKEEVQQVKPATEAALRAANQANLAKLTGLLRLVEAEKGSQPEIGDFAGKEDEIPAESFSKSRVLVPSYDGTGGWVYAGGAFSVNHPQVLPQPSQPANP